MMWAASEDRAPVLARLMREQGVFAHPGSLASCLMCAAVRGHVSCVALLVADSRVPLHVATRAGVSPLQLTHNQEVAALVQREHERCTQSMTCMDHITSVLNYSGGRQHYVINMAET